MGRMRFDKVDTKHWIGLGNALGNAYVSSEMGDRYKEGSTENKEVTYSDAPEVDRAAAAASAKQQSDADAAEFGLTDSERPLYDQSAGTKNQTTQYRLGTNGPLRDTQFSADEKNAAGIRSQIEWLRGRGQAKEADAMLKDQLANEAAADSLARGKRTDAREAEQRSADGHVANVMRHGLETADARNSGAINQLYKDNDARLASGTVSSDEHAATKGAIDKYYSASYAPAEAGAAYSKAYNAKAGLEMQETLSKKVREAFASKMNEFAMKDDWEGLGKFFTNNANYNDGKSYEYLGKQGDKVGYAIKGADGKEISRGYMAPAELIARAEATLDPKQGMEYWRETTRAKREDRALDAAEKRESRQDAREKRTDAKQAKQDAVDARAKTAMSEYEKARQNATAPGVGPELKAIQERRAEKFANELRGMGIRVPTEPTRKDSDYIRAATTAAKSDDPEIKAAGDAALLDVLTKDKKSSENPKSFTREHARKLAEKNGMKTDQVIQQLVSQGVRFIP